MQGQREKQADSNSRQDAYCNNMSRETIGGSQRKQDKRKYAYHQYNVQGCASKS